MERNKALKQATRICKVFRYLLPIVIIATTVVLIHWHYDPSFYAKVKVTEAGNIFLGQSRTEKGDEPVVLSLSELLPFTIYVLYLQGLARMILLLLIVRALEKIINSVKSLQTFRTENIPMFYKIGKYFLILFWVTSIRFVAKGHFAKINTEITFDPDLTPIFLMIAAYILAEIFKEGNRLYEEEQLTV